MYEGQRPRSWLGIRGKPPEMIHDELRLRKSRVPTKDDRGFEIIGAHSDVGWYLIVARGRDHRLVGEDVVQALSAGCEVITCTAEEQNYCSAAAGWRSGSRLWSVSYDGEIEGAAVVTEGDLPPAAAPIQARLTAESQAEDVGDTLVDPLYEIAIEIVASSIGYKPHAENAAFVGRFNRLEPTDQPWYRRIFA